MMKQNLRVGVTFFVLATICISTCKCACEPGDLPTSVDDFIENNSAHFKNEIQLIENQVNYMELAFGKEISIVEQNQELVAKTARQLEARMRSIAALNVKGKLCMTHFMGNVTGESVNLQNKLKACVDTAKATGKPVPDGAKNHIRNSRVQLNELTNTDLPLCRKNNGNSVPKFTECAKEKLKIRELNIQNTLKAASKEVESSICRGDIIARTAQECTFLVILTTQSTLSEIVSNINTCMGERLLEIK